MRAIDWSDFLVGGRTAGATAGQNRQWRSAPCDLGEHALRRFKRKVQQEDIIKGIKRHSFYLKLGEKRRVKEALGRNCARKKNWKESD
jgi:small subunit ribosomal protein S21